MTIQDAIYILRVGNEWRRGEEMEQPDPRIFGEAIDFAIRYMEDRVKQKPIDRSAKIDLLDRYTKFLQKECYIDTDATCEEPYAIDEFMKQELIEDHDNS